MTLSYRDEQAIRNAIRNGNSHDLAEAVRDLPTYTNFDEVKRVVDDAPGGHRYTRLNRIEMDCVTVWRGLGNRPEVDEYCDEW